MQEGFGCTGLRHQRIVHAGAVDRAAGGCGPAAAVGSVDVRAVVEIGRSVLADAPPLIVIAVAVAVAVAVEPAHPVQGIVGVGLVLHCVDAAADAVAVGIKAVTAVDGDAAVAALDLRHLVCAVAGVGQGLGGAASQGKTQFKELTFTLRSLVAQEYGSCMTQIRSHPRGSEFDYQVQTQ